MRLLPPRPELGWTPYAWLVYLAFFLLPPFLFGAGPAHLAWTAAALVVFLPLYFWGYWLDGWAVLWPMAGILALGVAFAPWNAGAATFFIYAAAFACQLGPPRRAFVAVLAVVGVLVVEAAFLDLPFFFWAPGVFVTLVVGGANVHYRSLSRAHARVLRSEREVERLAKIAERERIARDLHDLLGHTLSLIALKAELAARLAGRDPARAAREMREVERVSREALREVRAAVTGYRAQSLAGELDHARGALAAAGVEADVEAEPVALGAVEEGVLTLALREAVTNVVRHSGAERCRIRVDGDDAWVRLEVADDGRGGAAAEGSGLTGMRERVAGLGGRVERETGDGTRLVVALPRPSAETAA